MIQAEAAGGNLAIGMSPDEIDNKFELLFLKQGGRMPARHTSVKRVAWSLAAHFAQVDFAQAGFALGLEALNPFTDGFDADPEGLGSCLLGVASRPARDAPVPLDYAVLDGHFYGCPFGPPRITEVGKAQLPRPGPDG